MKPITDKSCMAFADTFYGTSTMGERGQIVIPAEARAEIGFQPGDKILMMRHPVHRGIMMFKIDAMREFLDDIYIGLERLEQEEGKLREAEEL